MVRDAQGPVAKARVRVQGETPAVLTDDRGRFQLPFPKSKASRVTAWKEGYAIGFAPFDKLHLPIPLTRLPVKDNEDYVWIDPDPHPHHKDNCGNCHGEIHQEWSRSAHGHAASNRRFRNLFDGTDWHGKPSRAWSLKDEHPLGTGVCASCHAPTYQDPTLAYDLAKVSGVAAKGVHCDYCHKIVDAPTEKLGTRFGRDGLKLLRPANDQQLFFGPLDDAVRPGELFAYSPLYKESRYCASCHEGVVFGVHVYSTYSEWLESPAKAKGQQCQDCHMTPTGKLTNIAPGKGGIDRNPKTLASHALPGATPEMLRKCLEVAVKKGKVPGQVVVEVRAHDVGHRVPTGFIDRHLILVVQAQDPRGKTLPPQAGPTLPPAAGKEFAGLAGVLFAKELKSPQGQLLPFWLGHRAAGKLHDNRLIPGRPERREFSFGNTADKVRVRLIYRRFWPEVAEAKNWPDADILVVDRAVKLPRR